MKEAYCHFLRICLAVLVGWFAARTAAAAAGPMPAPYTAASASATNLQAPELEAAPIPPSLLQRFPLSAITFKPNSEAAGPAFLDQEFIRSLSPEDLLVPFWIKVGDPRWCSNSPNMYCVDRTEKLARILKVAV